MPDLGKYAGDVLAAYGISFAILAVLIGLSLVQARRVKSRLTRAEQEHADLGQSELRSKEATSNG